MEKHKKAVLLLSLTALLWSISGVLIKYISLNPMAISGTRSMLASIILWIYVKKPKFTFSFAQIGGAIAYIIYVNCVVFATKMTTSANAVLLLYTAPIYTAILSKWMTKEKATKREWLIILIIFLGITLFFFDNLTTKNIWGNIIAIISGIGLSFFALFMRMQKNESPLESVLIGNVITAFVGVPFLFHSKLEINSLVALFILGTIQFALPYILFASAIKYVTALESVLIPIIDPILNPIWVFLFNKESPSTFAFLGGGIVLIAVSIKCIDSIKSEKRIRLEIET